MLAPLKQIFASSQQKGRKRVVFVLTGTYLISDRSLCEANFLR
jgi:hypothetical protein